MTDEPATTPADPRVTALALRCGQLREQRGEARRQLEETRRGWERDTAVRDDQRDRAKAAADALEASFRVEVRDLRKRLDAARAQAVQATTDADDLRARVEALAGVWERFAAIPAGHYPEAHAEADGRKLQAEVCAEELRILLEHHARHTETGPVAAASPETANDATPDLLGPQIGADDCGPVPTDEHNPTDPRCDYAPTGAPPVGLDKTFLMIEVTTVTDADTANRVANTIWTSRWLRERDALMRLTGAVAATVATPEGEGDPVEIVPSTVENGDHGVQPPPEPRPLVDMRKGDVLRAIGAGE